VRKKRGRGKAGFTTKTRRAQRKAKAFNTEGTESTERRKGFKTERQEFRLGSNPTPTLAFTFVLFVSLWGDCV
jgi:hypothetical protein